MVALKTFHNLSSERQQEIIAVCLQEFALHEYESASLTTIVSNLRLAKGSFYRYFENKQSLYSFLLDHCIQMRLQQDATYIKQSTTDFFELIAHHFAAKIQFDKQFPLHSAFMYNFIQEKNNAELVDIQRESRLKIMALIKQLIIPQAANNILRNDLDADTIAFMIFHTQLLINEYIAFTYQLDFRENIRLNKRLYELPEPELINISNLFIEILKNGIINRHNNDSPSLLNRDE
jgi:TetR/AcrR family transcriptional regulator